MSLIAYTVLAETASPETARAFSDWLVSGHIADVIDAGARSCTLVQLDTGDSHVHRFEVRYVFDSEATFLAYEAGPAVSLRAEGIALFGPESEHRVRFERTVGIVLSDSAHA